VIPFLDLRAQSQGIRKDVLEAVTRTLDSDTLCSARRLRHSRRPSPRSRGSAHAMSSTRERQPFNSRLPHEMVDCLIHVGKAYAATR